MNAYHAWALVGAVAFSLNAWCDDPKPAEAAKPKSAEAAPAAKLETRTFVLRYVKATEVAESLNKLCEKLQLKEAAVAFPESHSVAVVGPKDVIDACAKIVADIDRKPKQVYVEARFFDLIAGDMGALGLDWSMLGGGLGGTTPLSVSGGGQVGASGGKNLSDTWTYSGTISAQGLRMALAALRTNRDGRLFANPRVVVASGKRAVVDISTKRPNVIISAKRTTGNGNNNFDVDSQLKEIPGKDKMMFAGESFFWWGVGLVVEPYVGDDGVITARITPNVSTLSDASSQTEGAYVTASAKADGEEIPASRFPIIDVKRIETEFSLKSGETAVIGGLAKTEHEDIDIGIPVLSKIPGLKWLFGQVQRINRQREILVLVTMGLVDPEAPDKNAGLPKNSFLSREYLDGTRKEPGDHTKEELEEMLDRSRKFVR